MRYFFSTDPVTIGIENFLYTIYMNSQDTGLTAGNTGVCLTGSQSEPHLCCPYEMFEGKGCELLGNYDLLAVEVEQTLVFVVQVSDEGNTQKPNKPTGHLLQVRESTETHK